MNAVLVQALLPTAKAGCVLSGGDARNQVFCTENATDRNRCLLYNAFCKWNGDIPSGCQVKEAYGGSASFCIKKSKTACNHHPMCFWSTGSDPKPVPVTTTTEDPTEPPTTTEAPPTSNPKPETTDGPEPPTTTKAPPTSNPKPETTNGPQPPGDCYPCSDSYVNGDYVANLGYCEEERQVNRLRTNQCKGLNWHPCSPNCPWEELCAATCHKLDIKKCPCDQQPITTTTSTTTTKSTSPSKDPLIRQVIDIFDKAIPDHPDESNIKDEILIYEKLQNVWVPSRIYKKNDLLNAIKVAMETDIGGSKLSTFEKSGATLEKRAIYAAVNVAAFLGQAMQETIRYDACDENNWDKHNGIYYAASACGQLGQSYEDYTCEQACPKVPEKKMMAVTHAEWYGAPPPLFCAPKNEMKVAPLWHTYGDCKLKPLSGPKTVDELIDQIKTDKRCKSYEGQKSGQWDRNMNETPPPKSTRTDVEGCCWWGRGVIQTTGRCNFGKLNHSLGKASKDGLYSELDFCEDPEVICNNPNYPELKWIAGFFYYISEVQSWNTTGPINFNYEKELVKMVDDGFVDRAAFIGKVSGIVNRGCPSAISCSTGPVDALSQRTENFEKVLKALRFIDN